MGAALARAGGRAQDEGLFVDELVPVGEVDRDEGPRRDTSLERLAALKPVFDPEGTITAGNAPSVNDGAGCLVVASEEFARSRGLEILATIVATAAVADEFAWLARTPAGAGQPRARAGRALDRRRAAHRAQRGVLLGRPALDRAARRRPGAGQRQRRRGRARPSDRRVRRAHPRDARPTSCAATAAGSGSPRSAPAAARATRAARGLTCSAPPSPPCLAALVPSTRSPRTLLPERPARRRGSPTWMPHSSGA